MIAASGFAEARLFAIGDSGQGKTRGQQTDRQETQKPTHVRPPFGTGSFGRKLLSMIRRLRWSLRLLFLRKKSLEQKLASHRLAVDDDRTSRAGVCGQRIVIRNTGGPKVFVREANRLT